MASDNMLTNKTRAVGGMRTGFKICTPVIIKPKPGWFGTQQTWDHPEITRDIWTIKPHQLVSFSSDVSR
jgi:hypothetical protein